MKAPKLILGAGLALALTGATNVVASPAYEVESDTIKVSFADLNINHEAGAKVLYRRLQQASEEACSVDTFQRLGSLELLAKTKECYEETLDEVVAEINSSALQEIHSG